MIKKHIIPCTVIIALLVMAKVFAYNMPQAAESISKEEKSTTKKDTVTTKIRKPLSLMAQLNFAEESLPIGDARV